MLGYNCISLEMDDAASYVDGSINDSKDSVGDNEYDDYNSDAD